MKKVFTVLAILVFIVLATASLDDWEKKDAKNDNEDITLNKISEDIDAAEMQSTLLELKSLGDGLENWSIDDLYDTANACIDNMHYRSAKIILKYITLEDPQFTDAWVNLGLMHDKLKERSSAIACYEHAMEIEPNYYLPYYNRGCIYQQQGKHSSAIKDFTTSILNNPEHANSYYNRGISKYHIKDHTGEVEDYSKAIELEPGAGDFYCSRGQAYVDLNMNSKACEDFTLSYELGYEKASTYKNRYCK